MRSLVVSMFRRGVMKQHLYQNFSSSDGESFLRMVESYFDKAGKHTNIPADRLNFYKKP